METKQTAIDWLIEELGEYFPHEIGGIHLMVEKAKQIEKEQIVKAHNDGSLMAYTIPFNAPFIKGEEYYEENYGK
jgi:hypothetical protein